MTGGVVLKRTKGLSPTPAPDLEEVLPEPETANDIVDPTRNAYVLEHSPQILAALIIRRSGTKVTELADDAIIAVRHLYDRMHRAGTGATDDTDAVVV